MDKPTIMSRNITIVYLLPLFILYCLIFFLLKPYTLPNITTFNGDELRYATYAENIVNGFYAPRDTIFIWNGPGYPLLLAPFAYLKVPWIYAKMLNPVFMFAAVCIVFTILRKYMSDGKGLLCSYLFGLYPPFYAEMQYLVTEPFALFLAAAFALLSMKWLRSRQYRYLLTAGVVFAILALTKVFFGYVALAMLVLSLITAKWSVTLKKMAPVYGLGLLLCVPYLFYTYSLTGKIFYWAVAGGDQVYWLTTPTPGEYGDWKDGDEIRTLPQLAEQKEFFDKLATADFVERDKAEKKQAIENLINHPAKVAYNWVANVSRLFLNFPFSYKVQNPIQLFYLIPGAFLLIAILFCVYPLFKCRGVLPPEMVHSIVVFLVFAGGSSLLTTQARYLCTAIPFAFIVIAYVMTNLVKISNISTLPGDR
jgi:4-amino-4-deoxy-L-arabinose transferase-like glycosyltransferase